MKKESFRVYWKLNLLKMLRTAFIIIILLNLNLIDLDIIWLTVFTSPRKTAFFIFYISHINTRLDLDIFLSFGANDLQSPSIPSY